MSEPKPPKMGFEGKEMQAQASVGDDLWELHAAATKLGEFTAGRSRRDYAELQVLRAAVESMLRVMDNAVGRIAKQSAELRGRLGPTTELHHLVERLGMGEGAFEAWDYVEQSLPALVAGASAELETWHAG